MDKLDYADELQWKHSRRVGALRGDSHGGGMAPESAYLEDFELDETQTSHEAAEWFYSLPDNEQKRITKRAHEQEIENVDRP